MITFFLAIIFVIIISAYIILAEAVSSKFTLKQHLSFLFFISLTFIGIILRLCAYSPTADKLWDSPDSKAYIIRQQLEYFIQNPKEIKVISNSAEQGSKIKIDIIENKTGTIHNIWINDGVGNSWIHWYVNGQLAFHNGYLTTRVDDFKYVYYLSDSNYTNEALNDKIIDLFLIIIKNSYSTAADINLFNNHKAQIKTLEVTAPVNTIITGTVTEQGQIIHTETL